MKNHKSHTFIVGKCICGAKSGSTEASKPCSVDLGSRRPMTKNEYKGTPGDPDWNRDTPTKKKRMIAGHAITLIEGERYIATRPAAERGRKRFDVTISKWPLSLRARAIVTVRGLSYEEANRLVNAFNNGPTSFDGRVW